MSARMLETPDSAGGAALCRPTARLTVLALLAAFAFGMPDTQAQQTPETPPEEAAPQQETPQGAAGPDEVAITERQIKDWMVRCGRPDEQGPEICEMQQQQIDSEDRTVMAVAVGKVPGTSDVGLLIVLPLGILLPAGVTMQIDGGAEIPLQVERCERQGCRIERILEPELLNRLKAGKEAKVFFEAFDPQGERRRLGVPISLQGFTAALDEVAS